MRADPDYTGPIYHPDCAQGKQGYASKQVLKRTLRRAADRFGKSRMNIYRCPTCELYHYSSYDKAAFKRGTA